MTTPPEGDGADQRGLPYLPSARPSPPPVDARPAMPPAESRPALPPAEARHRFRVDPSFGMFATDTGRAAALQQLRVQAGKHRRRNRWLGRALAVFVLGGLGAAGWFGYRAYQNEEYGEAGFPADAAELDGEGDDEIVASLTPLAEQERVIEGIDALNDTALASAEGLLDVVQDARDIAGLTAEERAADALPAAADPFAARTVDFVYRRWETASSTSPMIEYFYSYDRIADTYAGDIRPGDGTVTVTAANDEYRFAIDPDGVVERVPRSGASLDAAPDIPLANVFRIDDALPPTARPFATLVAENLDTDFGDALTYSIDTERWRDRDPGSFLEWVTTWNPRPANDSSLAELDGREVGAEPLDVATLPEVTPSEPFAGGVERTAPGAGISLLVAEDGHVTFAAIVDRTADFRIEYGLVQVSDEPVETGVDDQDWVPAP